MKKAALLLYPDFSNYEISVTASIFMQAGKQLDVLAVSKEPVRSEEGLHFAADLTLDQFHMEDYDCLVLPGCWRIERAAEDTRYAAFLRRFQERGDILLAAICSGPLLLAQADLIGKRKFTIGLSQNRLAEFDFLDTSSLCHEAVVMDENIITAAGDAFVAFGIAIGRKLGLAFDPTWYTGQEK